MSMPWYGTLPERWEEHKTSELFVERREKVSDTDFAPLSVSKTDCYCCEVNATC